MSSHWYLRGRLFDAKHPEWDTLEPWPLTKAGTRKKRIGWHDRIAAGLKPSVTTWLQAIKGDSVDGLMAFSAKLGRDIGISEIIKLELEVLQDTDPQTLVDTFWAEYRKRRDEYSETGTRMHKVIEEYVQRKDIIDLSGSEATAAENAFIFLEANDLIDGGAAEYVVEGPDYAGTVDWHVPGRQCIVDWKTIRDEEGKPVRKPYPSELAQVAAYWHALHPEPFRDEYVGTRYPACNVYISQRTGDILRTQLWSKNDIERGFKLFTLAQAVTRNLKMIEGTF